MTLKDILKLKNILKMKKSISLLLVLLGLVAGKLYPEIKPFIDTITQGYPTATESAISLGKTSDGDSFVLLLDGGKTEERVRLYGVDAPELQQAYGQKAKEALEAMLKGKEITYKVYDTDQYDRKVAVLFADGINVNLAMLTAGHVWYYAYHCREFFCKDWERAAQQAKDEEKGLWKNKKPTPPWQYRSRQ